MTNDEKCIRAIEELDGIYSDYPEIISICYKRFSRHMKLKYLRAPKCVLEADAKQVKESFNLILSKVQYPNHEFIEEILREWVHIHFEAAKTYYMERYREDPKTWESLDDFGISPKQYF